MRVAVTASGVDLEAPTSPIFGRCPIILFVDSETMEFEAVENPAGGASGGAGIQAAQFVTRCGAEAVLTHNMGPNAYGVLAAAEVPVYQCPGGSVREAVEAYASGQLQPLGGANVGSHTGTGRGTGMGGGRRGAP